MIKYGLDWIGKTWTKLIKHGVIKNGLISKTWSDKTWINKTRSDKTWRDVNMTSCSAHFSERNSKLLIRMNQ